MLDVFTKDFHLNFDVEENEVLAVACSGGVDSMVLCHLFMSLDIPFSILHCNFRLRGRDSDQDAAFVRSFALEFNLVYHQVEFDTRLYAEQNKMSIQMAARELRYNWFHRIKEKEEFKWIATAHHLDDDLETLMINIGRGTGIRGMSGIPKKSKNFIRPILGFTKEQILDFALKNNIQWREDASNHSTDYLRNYLRLKVIPAWKKEVPDLVQGFLKSKNNILQSFQLQSDYLKLVKNNVWSEDEFGIIIDLEKLSHYNNPSNLLYELLYPYGFTAWEDIVDLQNAQSGKVIYSTQYRLIKDRKRFLLSHQKSTDAFKSYYITEPEQLVGLSRILNKFDAKVFKLDTKRVIFVSEKKIQFPMELRLWKTGDYFYPTGMIGKKKLSKYFKDQKYSLLEKEAIWVLCNEGQIVWVVGHRADRRFSLDSPEEASIKITI